MFHVRVMCSISSEIYCVLQIIHLYTVQLPRHTLIMLIGIVYSIINPLLPPMCVVGGLFLPVK